MTAQVDAKLIVCVTCGGAKCYATISIDGRENKTSAECAEFTTTEGVHRIQASRDAFVTETRQIGVRRPETSVKIDLKPLR